MAAPHYWVSKGLYPHMAAASPCLNASGEAAMLQCINPICQETSQGLLWGSSHYTSASPVMCYGLQVARLFFL